MSGQSSDLDVLIIVSSDPRYDTRSSKFLKALDEAGLNARLVGVCTDDAQDATDRITRLPSPNLKGKKFFLGFYRRVLKETLRVETRLIIAGDLFALPPAVMNKRKHSAKTPAVKLLYDSKELYRELPSLKMKKSSFIFWDLVERRSIKHVDSVLTVNDSISEILLANWRIPVTVVRNVPMRIAPPDSPKPLDKIVLAFSGGLQHGRGLLNLVRVLSTLPEKYELRFIGDGVLREELGSLAQNLGLGSRVQFAGRVKNDQVVPELSKAHLGVYLMENTGLCHYLALPNKFFQFISARLPVIVPKFPEMERIVRNYEIGESVNPENIEETRNAILRITGNGEYYARLRKNCDRAAEELNWEVEKGIFLRTVEELIK